MSAWMAGVHSSIAGHGGGVTGKSAGKGEASFHRILRKAVAVSRRGHAMARRVLECGCDEGATALVWVRGVCGEGPWRRGWILLFVLLSSYALSARPARSLPKR